MPNGIVRCPACGITMPFSELRSHVTSVHPEFLARGRAIRRSASRAYNVRYAVVVVPAIAVWATLTILAMSDGWLLGWPGWAVMLNLVGGMLLLPVAAAAYAGRVSRRHIRQEMDRPHPSGFCGATLEGLEERDRHLLTTHPEIHRRLESTKAAMRAAFLAYVPGFVVLLGVTVAGWISPILFALLAAALTAAVFSAVFWLRLSSLEKVWLVQP